jgi:hypothetical protein
MVNRCGPRAAHSSFHLVLESHDGRAFVPISMRSPTSWVTSTLGRLKTRPVDDSGHTRHNKKAQ